MWRLIFKDFEPSHCKMILLERLWTFPLQDDFVHNSVMLSAVLVYYIGVWFAQPAICIMWFCPCSNSIDLSHIIYIWYVHYLCSIDKQFNIFRQCTYIVYLYCQWKHRRLFDNFFNLELTTCTLLLLQGLRTPPPDVATLHLELTTLLLLQGLRTPLMLATLHLELTTLLLLQRLRTPWC